MFGLIRNAIAASAAPKARLFVARKLWTRMLRELNKRGHEEVESGAFLLGNETRGRRYVVDCVYYDDLDPHCADDGGIHLDHRAFGAVWEICKKRRLTVVADVHTHPGVAEQSCIDASNPAVSIAGHVALIVPNFARSADLSDLGIYEYLGSYRWDDRRTQDYLCVARWV